MTDPIEQLRSFGEDLRDSVPSGRSHVVAARAIGRARMPSRHRSWVVAAATLGMFVIANVAAAAVTDSSAPGDAFYGVDRAYEWVSDTLGLTHDHSFERLNEAEILLDRSDPNGALDLVAAETNDETVAMVAQNLQSSALGDEDLETMVMALVTDAKKIREAARAGDKQAKEEAKALLMTLIVNGAYPQPGPDTSRSAARLQPRPGQPGHEQRQPGQPRHQPGQPGQPGHEQWQPGQPGQPRHQPRQPGQPRHQPRQPGQPRHQPRQPGQPRHQPGQPRKAGGLTPTPIAVS